MKDLLVQSCSQTKFAAPGLLPALERYDGVSFRVIKKFFRLNAGSRANLKIVILSAEFGLIAANEAIPYYDLRMTAKRGLELSETVGDQWKKLIQPSDKFGRVFVNAGRDYLSALAEIDLKGFGNLTYAAGGIGRRLGQLKRWLAEDLPKDRK